MNRILQHKTERIFDSRVLMRSSKSVVGSWKYPDHFIGQFEIDISKNRLSELEGSWGADLTLAYPVIYPSYVMCDHVSSELTSPIAYAMGTRKWISPTRFYAHICTYHGTGHFSNILLPLRDMKTILSAPIIHIAKVGSDVARDIRYHTMRALYC